MSSIAKVPSLIHGPNITLFATNKTSMSKVRCLDQYQSSTMFIIPNTRPHRHIIRPPLRPPPNPSNSQYHNRSEAATNAQTTRTALPRRSSDLVAQTNEVVSEGLDGLGSVACNDILAVMRDDDGLCGLGDHDTVLALYDVVRFCLPKSTAPGLYPGHCKRGKHKTGLPGGRRYSVPQP